MHYSHWQLMDRKTNPAVAGLVAGAIHHLLIQYPNQATLFSTLYAYAFTNVTYVTLLLYQKHVTSTLGSGQILRDFLIFNAIYVQNPKARLTIAANNSACAKDNI